MFETLAPILIWVGIGLVGLALLTIVIFGARGLMYGKVEPLSAAIVVIPVVLLVVLGFVFQGSMEPARAWAYAGIWMVIVMFILGLLALLFSGVRGVLS